MPIYQYECEICGNKFEVQRKMTESDKELKCPRCGAEHPQTDFSEFSFTPCSVDTKLASDSGG
jgi:putative FmdB family regulatory protein